MNYVDDPHVYQDLKHLLADVETDQLDFTHQVRAFESFYAMAIDLIQKRGLTNPGNPVVFMFQNLQKTRSKEVLRARGLYEKARKPNAPKKWMIEFYRAAEEALPLMSIGMRGFLRTLRESTQPNLS